MAIDLALNEHQLQIQDAARQFFRARCPSEVVRQVEERDVGYLPDLWREMADLGWLGITFPEADGGFGGSFLDLFPIYEEMGRFLVPSPHLDTVAIAGDVLHRVGSDAQRQRLLPAIAGGRCLISLAALEPSGEFGPQGIDMRVTEGDGSYVLDGTKLLVGFAPSADHFLCAARTAPAGEGAAPDGVTLFMVDAAAPGLTSTPLRNIAGGALFAVAFDHVTVPADDVVGQVGRGWAALSPSVSKAAVLQTASIVGAARAVLDMTNQYAKDRVQFGQPIGSYQAVQYMVTDVLIDLHRADLLARQAAYRIDAGKPFGREAAMAAAFGKRAAAHLHRQAHEVHAGVAFMLEHDLTLFSRRSKFWENNLGDARYHEALLAAELGL